MRLLYVLRYFLTEAFSNLWSNRLNNFISMAIIVFSLFTFGLFVLTAENLSDMIGRWTENVRINVFLSKGTNRNAAGHLESIIKASRVVANYQFITEEEALRRFQKYYPGMKQLTTDLDTNPFPSSYEITIRKEFQNKGSVQELVALLRNEKLVEDVEYDQEWIDRIQFIIRFVRIVGLFFGGILMFTATFSISNVIKLMVLSRKDEIEIMRLVGATNSFIKGPFLAEGILQGLLGGIAAVVSLYLLYFGIITKVSSLNAPFFTTDLLHFLSTQMVIAVIAGGMVVGFFGSFFSVERLMRI
ncbi:permease-like cell division protein FtsX [bacterium]|nr:permease-like cell division protein FtsX [bacterium]MCI0604772.1 permease-like cell division protein FtsX [bacterium]